jgi:HTH-type transcriptional regulator, competence development regulator
MDCARLPLALNLSNSIKDAGMTNDQDNQQLAQLGSRIRSAREDRRLNLHELARLSGISAPALSLIENGKRDLRVTSLIRIAGALRVAVGNLLQDNPTDPTPDRTDDRKGYDLGDYR